MSSRPPVGSLEEEEEEMLNIRMSEQEYNDVTVHEYVGIR
jgi:hypothetical protein